MKNIFYLLLFTFTVGALSAQERYFDERYVYTTAHVNPILINPAAAGYNGGHEILLNFNNRWAGFKDSPKTYTFSYNGIASQRLGFGALVMKDSYGPLKMVKGQASISYGFETKSNKIRVGLSGEYISHSLVNRVGAEFSSDPRVAQQLDGTQFFDISIGMQGAYENKLSYGLVLPSLVNSRLNAIDTVARAKRDFGYILNLGYEIDVDAYDFRVLPSVYVKNLAGVPGYIELNVLFKFLEDKLSGGLTYSIGGENRLGFLIGTSINKLDFYYTYNVSNNDFQQYNNGSHELTLGFRLSDMKKIDEEK